ncbi:MAG: tRNA (adenosine(37)-N6)-dimethylallyltransferase MiaA [Blastomonas sp.]
MGTDALPRHDDDPLRQSGPRRPPVALIAGATASGKSGLAVALAKSLEALGRAAVIINSDSAQVYADLAIVSARPSEAEMQGVPHRLFGYLDGAIASSAAGWAADARTEIEAAHAHGAIPILVGGTGLYLRTLIDGIAPIPDIAPDIRAAVRALPVADAHAALTREDPDSARRLKPQDASRIARALEIVRSTGETIGSWQQRLEGGIGDAINLRPLVLLPPRDWLYKRCDKRFSAMIAAGAIAEVESLLARSLPSELPVMRAIGVPEIAAFLRNECDREAMVTAGQIATRRYAKRQYTWFRNQPPPGWLRQESEVNDNNIRDIVRLFRF